MAHREPVHRKAKDYRWEGVEELPYKEDDRALFKSITRQVLFSDPEMHGELRYFEMAPGGFSTLERHQHMHAVLILRGRGHCLVGGEVKPIETRDLVTVPPMTWHQFRATTGRAARLSLHGERHARQAATALGRGFGQARARCEDRRVPAQRTVAVPHAISPTILGVIAAILLGAARLRAAAADTRAPEPAGASRHLPRAHRDRHHRLRGRHGARGRGDGGAPARRRLPGGGHPRALLGAAQGQPGGAAARHRRQAAAAPARPSRRGRSQARGLGLRSVQAQRGRRLFPRPRRHRRQGDGGDLRRQPDPLRQGGLQARPRHHPGAHRRRGAVRFAAQRRALAAGSTIAT